MITMTKTYVRTVALCLDKLIKEGYTEVFKFVDNLLVNIRSNKSYPPERFKVVNFLRFVGVSNPQDSATLYILETDDGLKGTLVGTVETKLIS
jgi:hypothetical protein